MAKTQRPYACGLSMGERLDPGAGSELVVCGSFRALQADGGTLGAPPETPVNTGSNRR